MVHPLVSQLRFTRSEFQRALEGLSEEDAQRRLTPMNCISWNIGHLAWQEQRYWLFRAQGQMLLPHVNDRFAYGAPACTPSLREAWEAWHTITQATDPWLDAVTTATLQEDVMVNGKPITNFGSLLLRVIYHYWYHTGENMAIRQAIGHTGLPDFVGDIDGEAPYRPE
jgi:DinB family protein